jgi:hypothetical protein
MLGSDKARQRSAIRRLRGSLPRRPGHDPFAVRWARHKAGEIELEERKLARLRRRRPRDQGRTC